MKKQIFASILAAGLVAASGSALAQPTIDGSLDAAIYGTAVSVQTQDTSFGNAGNGSVLSDGGELDALYIDNDGTNLYLMVTGNIEGNGNILLVAIDSVPETGGSDGVFAGIDGADGYFNTNGTGTGIGGTTFPTGFNLDYLLAYKVFDDGGDSDLDWRYQDADVFAGTPSTTAFGNFDTGASTNPAIDTGSATIQMAYDGSNTAGVDGAPSGGPYTTSGNPGAVTTGVELVIPLSLLGSSAPGPNEDLNIICAYTSGNGDFWSNQTLPPWSAQSGSDHLATDPDLDASGIGFVTYTLSTNSSVNDWSLLE